MQRLKCTHILCSYSGRTTKLTTRDGTRLVGVEITFVHPGVEVYMSEAPCYTVNVNLFSKLKNYET